MISLNDRYQRNENPIHVGNDSKCYIGYDNEKMRSCFIKVSYNKDLIENEANILSKLNYPFVPQFYDYIQVNDDYILITEYIQGIKLEEILVDDKQIYDISTTVNNMGRLCENLMILNEKEQVIHADIKPANIIFTQNNAYIVDFGFSYYKNSQRRIINDYSRAPYLSGYLKDEWVSEDMYAYGKICYQFVTGCPSSFLKLVTGVEIKEQYANEISCKKSELDIPMYCMADLGTPNSEGKNYGQLREIVAKSNLANFIKDKSEINAYDELSLILINPFTDYK